MWAGTDSGVIMWAGTDRGAIMFKITILFTKKTFKRFVYKPNNKENTIIGKTQFHSFAVSSVLEKNSCVANALCKMQF